MHGTGHNHEAREDVVFLGRLTQLGQEQEREEEGGGHVDGDGGFIALGFAVGPRCDCGILDDGVESGELRCFLREGLDAGVAG
jgi:hypothetical protein